MTRSLIFFKINSHLVLDCSLVDPGRVFSLVDPGRDFIMFCHYKTQTLGSEPHILTTTQLHSVVMLRDDDALTEVIVEGGVVVVVGCRLC